MILAWNVVLLARVHMIPVVVGKCFFDCGQDSFNFAEFRYNLTILGRVFEIFGMLRVQTTSWLAVPGRAPHCPGRRESLQHGLLPAPGGAFPMDNSKGPRVLQGGLPHFGGTSRLQKQELSKKFGAHATRPKHHL